VRAEDRLTGRALPSCGRAPWRGSLTGRSKIRLRAYGTVWLNPGAGAPGFTLTVAAMAAIPHCAALLAAATFTDLTAAGPPPATLTARR
jgi:hypothetical protein